MMNTDRIRAASDFLPPEFGGDVVRELLVEVDRLRAIVQCCAAECPEDDSLEVNERVAVLRAHADELEAVIATLPQCNRIKDGKLVCDKPMMPGMKVWTTLAWEQERGPQEFTIPDYTGEFRVTPNHVDEARARMWSMNFRWCYDSREAAELAQKENK